MSQVCRKIYVTLIHGLSGQQHQIVFISEVYKSSWSLCPLTDLQEICYRLVAKLCPALHNFMDCNTARLSCPSLSPEICSNSCPLSQQCHPSSVALFSSYPQSFPASGSLPVNWLFASGGQSMGASASAAVQGTLKSLLQYLSSKASILWPSAFFMSNSHIHTWLLEKP